MGGGAGKGEGCQQGPGLSVASDTRGAQRCLRGWSGRAGPRHQCTEGTPPGICRTASGPILLAMASKPGCVQGRLRSALDPGVPTPDLRVCFSLPLCRPWLSDPTEEQPPWLWSPRPLCEGRWLRCCYFFTFIRDRWHVSPWRTPRWTKRAGPAQQINTCMAFQSPEGRRPFKPPSHPHPQPGAALSTLSPSGAFSEIPTAA